MATLAQLQAEAWWGREVVTPELDWLGDELCRRTGRPRDAAGTKGNVAHLRGAHRSQEWILKSRYCTSRTYTVQGGLTAEQLTHVAGFDFMPGSAAQMIAMCKRLDAALRAGGLEEIREFYGNTNGDQVVDGWDNLANRAATSDDSHLWHTHLSFDRRQLRNRSLMERVVAVMLGDDHEEEEDMSFFDESRGPSFDNKTGAKLVEDIWYVLVKTAPPTTPIGRAIAALGHNDVDVDEAAIARAVLATLTPAAIAAALPADLAREVADELAARLAG